MNKKELFRLYLVEGLAARRRRGRKRAIGTRAPWRFRILCVVDDFTRKALAPVAKWAPLGIDWHTRRRTGHSRTAWSKALGASCATSARTKRSSPISSRSEPGSRSRLDYNHVRPHSAHVGVAPEVARLRNLISSTGRPLPPALWTTINPQGGSHHCRRPRPGAGHCDDATVLADQEHWRAPLLVRFQLARLWPRRARPRLAKR